MKVSTHPLHLRCERLAVGIIDNMFDQRVREHDIKRPVTKRQARRIRHDPTGRTCAVQRRLQVHDRYLRGLIEKCPIESQPAQVENPCGRIHAEVGNKLLQPLCAKVARKRPMQAEQSCAAGMMFGFVLHVSGR